MQLGRQYIGPFEVEAVVNLVSMKLRLPPTLKMHAQNSGPLAPPPTHPPPPRLINGDPMYSAHEILDSTSCAGLCSTRLSGKVTVQRSVSGSPHS